MSTEKPLEYLTLNPDQKIMHKQMHGPIIDWYNSFAYKPIDRRYIRPSKAAKRMGLTVEGVYHLLSTGIFARARKDDEGWLLNQTEINQIMQREAYFIPVSAFYKIIGNYYMERRLFDKSFGKHFQTGLDRRANVVSFTGAAKILQQLNLRKEIIETWPTLHDLNRESGLNLPTHALHNHFGKRIKAGEVRAILIGKYDKNGQQRSKEYKIPPQEYQRLLQERKQSLHALQTGVTTTQLAHMLNTHRDSAATLVKFAGQVGLVNVTRTSYDPRGGGKDGNFIISLQDAQAIASGRILIPNTYQIDLLNQKRKMLTTNMNTVSSKNLTIPRCIERKLWEAVKNGSDHSFEMLLKMYERVIATHLRRMYEYNENRLDIINTAFFEAIISADEGTTRNKLLASVALNIQTRLAEEKPSLQSLDEVFVSESDDRTFLDKWTKKQVQRHGF